MNGFSELDPKCDHAELVFGSGDYYLFCHACGRKWALMGHYSEYGRDKDGQIVGADPEMQGDGHVCSEKRVKIDERTTRPPP